MAVKSQNLGIDTRPSCEHLHQLAVMLCQGRRCEVSDHGLAHAVVVGLDLALLRWAGTADQPTRSQKWRCPLVDEVQAGSPRRIALV